MGNDKSGLVASPLKPKKFKIGYATKARRVDVKLLKKSIWRELAPPVNDDDDDDDEHEQQQQPEAAVEEEVSDTGNKVMKDVTTGKHVRHMPQQADFRQVLHRIPP